jgi:biopolymer transport protein ExbB/TolQ
VVSMKIILDLILILAILYTVASFLDFLSLTTKRKQLKQQVIREQEALRKELDELDKEAFHAFNKLFKESMRTAEEEYQQKRAGFSQTNPTRKDVEEVQ